MTLISKLNTLKALILDMDGVLWRDNQPVGNLPEIFANVNRLNIQPVLATNNSTRTVQQYLERVRNFGVNLEPWQVVTSAQAVASLLKQRYPEGAEVYVVGEDALRLTLEEFGFTLSDSRADVVVAGMDRELTYKKIRLAARFIRAGAAFYGTNPDRTFPTPEGLVPGAGVVLAAIETATDVTPIIAGKPAPAMYELALQRLGVFPWQTLVVGDRLDTDIACGQEMGCLCALVLSGVTDQEEANVWLPQPDIIAPDLTTVVQLLMDRQNE